jgi:hypothetical protein
LRRFTLACGLVLACLLASGASALCAEASWDHGTVARVRAITFYTREITRFRKETWYWQRVMGVRPTRLGARRPATLSVSGVKRLDSLWHRLENRASRQAHHPPHLAAWLCIHRYEGSWSDSGAPYWGGLQMDLSFQAVYGGRLLREKGTADHWSPLEQIWTAVRAARTRGFSPWPNSARLCGLI